MHRTVMATRLSLYTITEYCILLRTCTRTRLNVLLLRLLPLANAATANETGLKGNANHSQLLFPYIRFAQFRSTNVPSIRGTHFAQFLKVWGVSIPKLPFSIEKHFQLAIFDSFELLNIFNVGILQLVSC